MYGTRAPIPPQETHSPWPRGRIFTATHQRGLHAAGQLSPGSVESTTTRWTGLRTAGRGSEDLKPPAGKPDSPARMRYRCWLERPWWSPRSWRCNCGDLNAVAHHPVGDPDGRCGDRHAAARVTAHRGQMVGTADLTRRPCGVVGGRGRVQTGRRTVSVRRKPPVDTVVRDGLHPRRRRHRTRHRGADDRVGTAADHRRLERRQRPDRLGGAVGAHVLRADACGRGHGADVARLAGRAAVLRVLRGHADPDVLPDWGFWAEPRCVPTRR